MITKLKEISEAQFLERCISPDLGKLLPDYMVELLAESAANEVEEHLLLCPYCSEWYLRMLAIREVVSSRKTMFDNDRPALARAEIVKFSDYKK